MSNDRPLFALLIALSLSTLLSVEAPPKGSYGYEILQEAGLLHLSDEDKFKVLKLVTGMAVDRVMEHQPPSDGENTSLHSATSEREAFQEYQDSLFAYRDAVVKAANEYSILPETPNNIAKAAILTAHRQREASLEKCNAWLNAGGGNQKQLDEFTRKTDNSMTDVAIKAVLDARMKAISVTPPGPYRVEGHEIKPETQP